MVLAIIRVEVAAVVEAVRAWRRDAEARRLRHLKDEQTRKATAAVAHARHYGVPLMEQVARANLSHADWPAIDTAFGPPEQPQS